LGNQEVDSWQRAAICDVELIAKIHGKKRMLVITAPDNYFRWLCSMADVKDLLKPFPSDLMEAAPVGNRVTPRDDGASLFTVGE
jgi:putative SOS response-associated peptidase YedK